MPGREDMNGGLLGRALLGGSISLFVSTGIANPVLVQRLDGVYESRDLEIEAAAPAGEVLVYSELPDGTLREGIWAVNRHEGVSPGLTYSYPIDIQSRADGSLAILDTQRAFIQYTHGGAPPGMAKEVLGWNTVPVGKSDMFRLGPLPTAQSRVAVTLNYLLPSVADTEAFFGAGSFAQVQATAFRVRDRITEMLGVSAGNITIRIRVDDPDGIFDAFPNSGAVTGVDLREFDLKPLIDRIGVVAGNNDEPSSEITYYEQFLNNTIPYDYSATQTNVNASVLLMTTTILPHLLINSDQPVIEIFFNDAASWDVDPGDGIFGGDQDFEAWLTHESLHALGFNSRGDIPLGFFPITHLTVLDAFRFDASVGAVFGSDVRTEPRQLRPDGAPKVFTQYSTSLNAFEMSRGTRPGGDGFMPDHWDHSPPGPTNTAIGIMDPLPNTAARRSRWSANPRVDRICSRPMPAHSI